MLPSEHNSMKKKERNHDVSDLEVKSEMCDRHNDQIIAKIKGGVNRAHPIMIYDLMII